MWLRGRLCEHERVAKRTLRLPSVHRSTNRVITGTAGGWGERYGIDPTVVRVALALLTFVAGLGAVLYGVMFLLADPPEKHSTPVEEPLDHRRDLAVAAATGAVLVAARHLGVWPGDRIMLPAAAVAVGVAIVWSRAGDADRRDGPFVPRAIRLGAGVVLLIAGVASLANLTGGLGSVGASLSAIAVVIGGLAMFGAPALGRILRELDEERSTRIREDERAKVSAHLHDSVLQSLVLIQRSDDPRRMANLARRQERELRAWLYGDVPIGDPTTLHAAIEVLTTELEADHDTRIEAVIVGDQPLDEASRALIAALREATVNAARHADVDRIDIFVEADDTELTGFVRDTGIGFDPAAVPPDRHGINDSIIGRVERVGGTAVVETNLGAGTEVEIRIPRRPA
jgi:signal transduction histidine kinase/phage shock protein PspC (stress-responsive transcriptional regulator)